MTHILSRTRLETEALIVGYAMSRLDTIYLAARHLQSWQNAFQEAAQALGEPTASFKNLRDEFDPVHPNPRRGWINRPMRPNRQRILDEMAEVSDDALLELVTHILFRDEEAVVEAVDALAVVTHIPSNVAERLLTGRRAEEYFLRHCEGLIGVKPAHVLDLRQSALGFDFGIQNEPSVAVEVKGLKTMRGPIQFTDREWAEAKQRQDNYLLVVVGNLAAEPLARVFPNPHSTIEAKCRIQTSVTAHWYSTVTITL
jgi:hypothetical protein